MSEPGAFRQNDPDTSVEAARAIDTSTLQGMIMGLLHKTGGLTTYEMADRLERPLVSISPRMKQLVEKKLAQDSGTRRLNPSGRRAIVWEVRPKQEGTE